MALPAGQMMIAIRIYAIAVPINVIRLASGRIANTPGSALRVFAIVSTNVQPERLVPAVIAIVMAIAIPA